MATGKTITFWCLITAIVVNIAISHLAFIAGINLGLLFLEGKLAGFVFLGGEVGTDMIMDLCGPQRSGRLL
jgi:hypothetical protein